MTNIEIKGNIKKFELKVDNANTTTIKLTGDFNKIYDGYHTTDEIYAHRILLFITLMKTYPGISWKSRNHEDGTSYDGWFIAGMNLSSGDISYHIPEQYWNMLDKIPTLEKAKPWDGYTSEDVIKRLHNWCFVL
jgi:hypothetical protein